jgi:DNA-binding transcriptional LysR family regulator
MVDLECAVVLGERHASHVACESVALIAVPYVLPHLKSGALQRVLPDWYSDQGAISLYFTSQKLLPAKTRAFVDHITAAFREQKLSRRFSATG